MDLNSEIKLVYIIHKWYTLKQMLLIPIPLLDRLIIFSSFCNNARRSLV